MDAVLTRPAHEYTRRLLAAAPRLPVGTRAARRRPRARSPRSRRSRCGRRRSIPTSSPARPRPCSFGSSTRRGRVGIGDTDAPALAVRELVHLDDVFEWSRGLRSMLLGRDPFEIAALHADLSLGTLYHGRRGLSVHALSAVDIALYDLVGKQLARPVNQLLGGARPGSYRPLRDDLARGRQGPNARPADGRDRGARRAGALAGLPGREDGGDLRGCRLRPRPRRLHQGRTPAPRRRRRHARRLRVPLARLARRPLDALAGRGLRSLPRRGDRPARRHRRAREARCPPADPGRRGRVLGDRPRVPGVARAGAGRRPPARPEPLRRADRAAPDRRARRPLRATVVPHGSKTGITVAAGRHFHAATQNSPLVETFHPDLYESELRRELVRPELEVVDGRIPLPVAPGLGVELAEDVVERYRVA